MKNLNLLNRLLSYSHEKQSPQRFGRYAAMLIMLLTLGVGQVWAKTYAPVALAISSSELSSANANKVKYNAWDNDSHTWLGFATLASNLTFDGKKLYFYGGTYDYDGVQGMQWQLFNNDTYKTLKQPYDCWTSTGTFKGRIYNYSAANAAQYANQTMTTGARVYFDASTWDGTTIKLVTAHAYHQKYYTMSLVTNTKLYYVTNGDTWSDAMGCGVVSGTHKADGGHDEWLSDVENFTEYSGFKNYGLNATGDNQAYLIVPSGKTGQQPTINYYSSAFYNSLNSTQTIKYAVATNGASPVELTEGTVPADISISSYKFSSGKYNAVDASSGSVTLSAGGSNYSATVTAARTATTTYTVSNVDGDYAFLGWYSAASGGTLLEDDETYTFYPTEATTVYARFSHENNHSVTISRYCTSTSSQISSTSQNIGEVTYSSITAPTIAGYSFVNWTLSNGLSKHSSDELTSNPIRVITLSSGTYTLTANYTEVLTTDWELIGDNYDGSPFGDNYTYGSGKSMLKAHGASTTNRAYKTLNVTKTGTWYFKVATANDNDHKYGWGTSTNYKEFKRADNGTNKDVYTGSQNPVKFSPDGFGEYEFEVDYRAATCSVKVTFPTVYAITYGKGTGGSTVSASYSGTSFSSSTKVQTGKTVRFTQTAETGYTFKEWNTNNTGTGTQLSTDATYNRTVASSNNVYAIYTENKSDITIEAGDNGSITTPADISDPFPLGVATKQAIVAAPDAGYYFVNWTCEGTAAVDNSTSASTNAKTNGTKGSSGTVTANFAARYSLRGSKNEGGNPAGGMPGWSVTTSNMDVVGSTSTKTVTLEPNTNYKYKIYDNKPTAGEHGQTSTTYQPLGTEWTLNGSNDVYFTTRGYGSYTFSIDENTNPEVTVTGPTSYKLNFGSTTIWDTGGANSKQQGSRSGGTVRATTTESATEFSIDSAQYIRSGGTAVFTATPSTGYTFAGWYSDKACTTAYDGEDSDVDIAENVLTLSSIGADKTVYAKFTEKMTTVTINTSGSGKVQIYQNSAWSDVDGTVNVGVHTTYTIKAVPASGYYVSGWTVAGGSDCALASTAGRNDNESQSTTLRGLGSGTTGTVTANFTENDKIYFRNIFDNGAGSVTRWSKVYVGYSDHWDNSTNCGGGSCGADTYGCATAEMEKIGESDVYWAYVPRAFTYSNATTLVFFDYDMRTWEHFSGHNASRRSDYKHALNMFVPNHTKSGTTNGTNYYSNGYWMQYEAEVGKGGAYYLKRLNDAGNGYNDIGEMTAIADGVHKLQYTFRVDNLTATRNKYIFSSAAGLNYKANATITSANCTNVNVFENNGSYPYFEMTPTSEGNYTFILDQTGDVMQLTVIYPVAVGDYRLKHTYSSTYTTYSDVIKSGATSTTASMYLNTSSTPTFVLEKCTAVSPSVTWTVQGSDLWSTHSSKFNKGKGVYQFDIAISDGTPSTISSLSNVGLYEGEFYIKTDCATGGWVNYTQNIMDKNTINASDFDHYFCKNVASGTNVKFVIANDYNIAITDSIKADATYLTTSGGGSVKEYMPEASCIRFSYNSATNEAKRAYLRYSNNNNFLNIIPSAANTVYAAAEGATELFGDGSASSTNKFGDDDGNFVYRKTVYAVSGATINVMAEYTTSSKKQSFVTGHELITSSDKSARYPIQVVYDFKTNNLTTAWHPGASAITAAISDVDYMYIRDGQAAADQLTFSGGKLTDAKVCGAFQFKYNDYVGRVGAWPEQAGQTTGYTNEKCMFYFSFPFNVKVSDIFGIGTYGKEWKIQYYDGAERAKKGFFRGDGTTTFWKDMQLGDTLKAYIGYSLLLDNDYFNTTASGMVFNGKSAGSSVYLYFPSYQTMSSIASETKDLTIAPLTCELTNTWYDAETKQTLSHSNTDSHWNMLGVPLLSSQTGDFSSKFSQSGLSYLYKWNSTTNTLTPAATGSGAGAVGNFTFQAMGAYMVQFTGTITFSGAVPTPSAIAARQKQETKNYTVDLEVLDGDDERINHTYVELRDGASDDFVLSEDMYMTRNSNVVNIYSFAGDYDVAANVLSLGNHVVPVGVAVKKAGTYKFSMPYEFSGTVTLVDKFNNTRTNLAFDEYEVYLEKGSINDRFDMEINIHKVPTSIENVDGNNALNDGGVHKFIENDQMYILKNGTIYNAQGALVK